MKLAIIAFTDRGERLANRLSAALPDDLEARFTRCLQNGLTGWVKENFSSSAALIFISSAGIAVRAVAPFLKSKLTDPAVISIDELGRFVIPLASGHIGGANELSQRLSALLCAKAVITTATDINDLFAVDVWAKRNGFFIACPERIKNVSSRLLSTGEITVQSDFKATIADRLISRIRLLQGAADVHITCADTDDGALRLVPRALVLGVGCKKGVAAEDIERAFERFTAQNHIDRHAFKKACSIDIKANEPGLNDFCSRLELPLETFSARLLGEIQGEFSSSEFVKSVTGVDNVCERSTLAGGGERLVAKKAAFGPVTMAAAMLPLSFLID